MPEQVERSISLRPKQLEYLERMVEAHSLPDVSKAVRILVAQAMSAPELEDELFETIRCAKPETCDHAHDATGRPREVR